MAAALGTRVLVVGYLGHGVCFKLFVWKGCFTWCEVHFYSEIRHERGIRLLRLGGVSLDPWDMVGG